MKLLDIEYLESKSRSASVGWWRLIFADLYIIGRYLAFSDYWFRMLLHDWWSSVEGTEMNQHFE